MFLRYENFPNKYFCLISNDSLSFVLIKHFKVEKTRATYILKQPDFHRSYFQPYFFCAKMFEIAVPCLLVWLEIVNFKRVQLHKSTST